jgi:hypothetical protein
LLRLQSRIITSGSGDWRYVDVVAVRAGKLEALEWVRKLYNVPVKVRGRLGAGWWHRRAGVGWHV